jgi:hypothetical protein
MASKLASLAPAELMVAGLCDREKSLTGETGHNGDEVHGRIHP